MFLKNFKLYGVLASALAITSFINPAFADQKPIKVRWLIAHEPLDAFRRAAKTFSEQLKRESNGQMELVVLLPKDVGSTTGNVDPKDIFALLKNGDVELSQTQTSGIGEVEPNFYALDLPYLFRSHEHATKVLDGKIGQKLLTSLEKSNVRGLAFTYSGGYRVVPSLEKAIRRPEDFKGMRVRTTSSPVAQATLRELGAIPVPMSLATSHDAIHGGDIDAAETTYIRVSAMVGDKAKYLNETFHSLFLTSILASDKFYKSLSPENREALKRAAMAAAKIERKDSIDDGEKVKADFKKRGIKIVKMSSAQDNALRSKVKSVYGKFENVFEKDLVNDIVATK